LPCFLIGLIRTFRTAGVSPKRTDALDAKAPMMLRTGRLLLLVTAGGLIAAGLTIVAVGMTVVFVPQDLHFMALQPKMLSEISPRLIPLIAHDRAGFGGGLASTGILIAFCAWYAPSSRSFRQAILISGLAGFGCAIGIHYLEGYTDLTHLAPALLGGLIFLVAAALEIASASNPPTRCDM